MRTRQLYRKAIAARECGVSRQALQHATAAGKIRTHRTACGLPLVDLEEVQAYFNRPKCRAVKTK